MSGRGKIFITWLPAVLLAASLVLGALSFGTRAPGNADSMARKLERTLSRRLQKLEKYEQKALQTDPDEWMNLGRIPEDMVVYRYVDDSLTSWAGRFSTNNDRLQSGVVFQHLVSSRASFRSPLNDIGPDGEFHNIGPKWYMARSAENGRVRVISGLEISNILNESTPNGVNPRLRVPGSFSLQELSASGGSAVYLLGEPVFKLIYDSPNADPQANTVMLWIALSLFVAAALLFLSNSPGLGRMGAVIAALLGALTLFYFLGKSLTSTDTGLFSPLLYADTAAFYSLGALMIVTLMVCLPIWCLFICKDCIRERCSASAMRWLCPAVPMLLMAGVLGFSYVAIHSVVFNSNINLEIYKIKEFTWLSAEVYLLLLLLFSCVPMLLEMIRRQKLSIAQRAVFSFAVSVYVVVLTASLGFRKEQSSLEVWANRLAMSRDISLEMQLRGAEERIAQDMMIASLSVLDNTASAISGRISDIYLPRVAQSYDIVVITGRPDITQLRGGEIISPESRFVYKETSGGIASYYALFHYNIQGYGISELLLEVRQKGDWRYRGYSGILGESNPGEVLVPARYSYARYRAMQLLRFRGEYAYPMHMDQAVGEDVIERGTTHLKRSGYTHFIYKVSDSEQVVFSRRTISFLYYSIAGMFIALLTFLIITVIVALRSGRTKLFPENYFQTRLRWVIMLSMTLALVSLATMSVYFVYTRNEQSRMSLMSSKINSIAASISARIAGARSVDDLRNAEILSMIEDVGNNLNSDITLYEPGGMVLMSTAPGVFDRLLMDGRMDERAYDNVVNNTSRYYIQKEKVRGNSFYSMYAPLMDDNGNELAIISVPYTDDDYEFETGAINHALMIVSLFMFLLLLASFTAGRVLTRMFEPLMRLGAKMEGANLDSLEYIDYDKQDEITGLVNAYNRMVSDLSESSRKLAEAERDKAWSGMARQVAHEIKNPLTPMKLQIQRVMRLKAKGDPSWQEKFDDASKMLLDHIDILTETANDFSTFAKLYVEEPTEIDLDKLLQEEIAMFEVSGVQFEYMGLAGAVVMGPKPQLTRVFVNLLNNAVQALEGVEDGRVLVSLRNSSHDGCYDIVFEDNGPGVAPENESKLFTPNFTTKTGGSGIGLAMSRSILQKCDAQISYSRSFALGGACFKILYPRNK